MTRRHVPLLAVLLAAVVLTACAPEEREDQRQALARWEDRRLAPIDSLAALLAGPDANVRRAALRTAGLIGRTDVLPPMIRALEDRSQGVRSQAAFSLGLIGGDVALAPLEIALRDPHLSVRQAASEGLAHQDHDGSALYPVALEGEVRAATAAWTALRNVAGRADRDSLVAAIRAGLARPEPAVRWRVLRCAERAPDSTLVPQIAPYAIDRDVPVRVHALRALRYHDGPAAIEAVLRSSERRGRLRGQDLRRVLVAELRALGDLAGPVLAGDDEGDHLSLAGRMTAVMTAGASSADQQVAEVALRAMATAVADLPLPPQAARQESLLPVWRLRMVRVAREQLDATAPAVRGAACLALGALRGDGAAEELAARIDDPDPMVAADAITALGRLGSLSGRFGVLERPWPDHPITMVALLTALAADTDLAADEPLAGTLFAQLPTWLTRADFTVRTAACDLAARLPGGHAAGLLAAAVAESEDLPEGRGDVALAALGAIETLVTSLSDGRTPYAPATADTDTVTIAAPASILADSLATVAFTDSHRRALSALLQRTFDDPDLRIRLRARTCAEATDLLPPSLIPSAASLRETLPPVERHPDQPEVRTAFTAPDVRVVTDRGTFTIRLAADIAPNTCAAFLHLVRTGFHDDLTFHRVVPDFVIQGGCPRGDGWGGPGWTIRSEWSRRPFERGTVGIAHSGKDTGGSQWFVCHSAQPHLNGRYTVFGEVVDGMDVVDRIERGDRYRIEVVAD
jgi:cyclophilin family peptidyl-prolyl cis-trans isomerase/HEAT repeat protein